MKKLLIFLIASAISLAGFSQTAFLNTASNPTGAITNNSIDTVYYVTSRSYPLTTIQAVITKTSGTIAGTYVLSNSVDGVNYVNISTISIVDGAINTNVWSTASAARYWRIITGGSTTVAATVKAYISAPY